MSMLYIDWQLALSLLSRIGIATLLGGLIGLERQTARRHAGLRTHILITLGAALVMCTGEFVFASYADQSNLDPARLGAQVVSGIGVLCAGTIMKAGSTVKGLTTATGLWCAACIGLAAGSGNIIPAVGVTIIAVVVLWLFRNFEERRLNKKSGTDIKMVLDNSSGSVEQLMTFLSESGFQVDSFQFERSHGLRTILNCSITFKRKRSYTDLALQLSSIPYILSVEPITE